MIFELKVLKPAEKQYYLQHMMAPRRPGAEIVDNWNFLCASASPRLKLNYYDF